MVWKKLLFNSYSCFGGRGTLNTLLSLPSTLIIGKLRKPIMWLCPSPNLPPVQLLTATAKMTATRIFPPSYHPSLHPPWMIPMARGNIYSMENQMAKANRFYQNTENPKPGQLINDKSFITFVTNSTNCTATWAQPMKLTLE